MLKLSLLLSIKFYLFCVCAYAQSLTPTEIKVQFLGVAPTAQSTVDRSLNLRFSTCLGQPNLEVQAQPGNVKTKTDAQGCLTWKGQYRHKIYQSGDQVMFVSLLPAGSQDKISVPVFINPFRSDTEFAVDGRFIDEERKKNKAQPAPFVQIPSVLAQFSGTDFRINSVLDITFVRRYSLMISPEIIRPDMQSISLSNSERLRDGKYLLRASLFLGDENLSSTSALPLLIDSYERVVDVVGSRVQTQIELSTSDLIVWGGRNSIAFELYPLRADGKGPDLSSGLQPRVFWGSFTPSNELSNILIARSDSDSNSFTKMNQVIKEHKQSVQARLIERQQKYSLDSYVAENGLTPFMPKDAKYKNLPIDPIFMQTVAAEGLLKLTQNKTFNDLLIKNLRPLCRLAFMDGFKINSASAFAKSAQTNMNCEKEPLKFFSLDHRIHILDPKPRATWLGGRSQSFNVASSFDLSSGRSLSSSLREGTSVSAGASIRPMSLLSNVLSKVPLIKDFFSAAVDFQWSKDSSRSDSFSESNGHSINFSHGVYLIEQQAQLEIQVQKYRPCLSITLNDQALGQHQGFHFCADVVSEPTSFFETYYFFSQHFSTGDFIDARHPNNRPFVLSLRGNRDYFTFLNMTTKLLNLTDASRTAKSSPQEIFVEGVELFSHEQRAYPGSISTFTNKDQIDFMLRSETNVKAKDFLTSFLQELSPFSRHNIKPLAAH